MLRVISLLCLCTAFASGAVERVLARDISAITLTQGKWTTNRQAQPVPQLKCVGGLCPLEDLPATAVCTNVGFDGHDVQWKCEGEMGSTVRFSRITVLCEGYDWPDDPWVLYGSCGLEYELQRTGDQTTVHQHHRQQDSADVIAGTVLFVALIVICIILLALPDSCWIGCLCCRENHNSSTTCWSSDNHVSQGYGGTRRR